MNSKVYVSQENSSTKDVEGYFKSLGVNIEISEYDDAYICKVDNEDVIFDILKDKLNQTINMQQDLNKSFLIEALEVLIYHNQKVFRRCDFEDELSEEEWKKRKSCPICGSKNYGIASEFGDRIDIFDTDINTCAICDYYELEPTDIEKQILELRAQKEKEMLVIQNKIDELIKLKCNIKSS